MRSAGVYCALMISAVCSALFYSDNALPTFVCALILCAVFASAAVYLNAACMNIQDPLEKNVLRLVYRLLFICAGAVLMTRFALFLSEFTPTGLRFYSFIAAVVFVCAYASKCGGTAVLRCCIPLFALCFAADLLMLISFVIHSRAGNLVYELKRSDYSPAAFAAALPAALLPFAAVPAVLLSQKGSVRLKPALPLSVAAAFVFASAISAAACAVLGSTAPLAEFPIYSAARASGRASLRTDMLFLCRQVIGTFVMLSLYLCAARRPADDLVPSKNDHAGMISAAAVFIISAAAVNSYALQDIILSPAFMIAVSAAAVLILPIAAIIVRIVDKTIFRSSAALLIMCVIISTLSGCDGFALNSVPCAAMSTDASRSNIFVNAVTTAGIAAVMIAVVIVCKKRKTKLRKSGILLLICLPMIILAGCDDIQLQNRMIVKGMGIDLDGAEYRVAVQYIDNYSDGDRHENRTIVVRGSSVSDAVGELRRASGSDAFFGQLEAVVLSRDVFERHLYESLDHILRYSEAAPSARLYVSESSAADILTFSQKGTIEPIDHMISIYPTTSKNDARFTVLGVMDALLTDGTAPYACTLKKTDSAVRLNSAIYLVNDRSHIMNEEEFLTFCILNSLKSELTLTVDKAVCEIISADTGFDIDSGATVKADIDLKLKVLENGKSLNMEQIERKVTQRVREMTQKNARRLLQQRADVFGLSKIAGEDLTNNPGAADIEISVTADVS